MLKIKYFDGREEFLQSKSNEYKRYTLVSLVSLSIACFLFCGWDYVIDPQGSKSVFLLRVLMLAAFIIYYIPYKLTNNYKILSLSIYLSMFYLLVIYLFIIKNLNNGAEYSINGFIIYNLSLVSVSYGMSLKNILFHQVLGFILPVIIDLFIFHNTISYAAYMIVIPVIMILCIAISYSLYLAYCEKYTLQNRLKELAFVDNLTQCYNRSKFDDVILKSDYLNNTDNLPICIMLIDIDDFKNVNDKFGHKAGDLVLQQISKCIKDNLREKDTIYRWGGEEFLVLLPNTNINECCQISKGLVDVCNKTITPAGQVSISVGYGNYNHDDIDSLIIDVDKALYEAKKRGKNQSCQAKIFSLNGKNEAIR